MKVKVFSIDVIEQRRTYLRQEFGYPKYLDGIPFLQISIYLQNPKA